MLRILFLTNLSLCINSISASEPESFPTVKPCSKDECHAFREILEPTCGRSCRNKEITKLARSFDLKKDLNYLRSLICANKSFKNPDYTSPGNEVYFYGDGDQSIFIYYELTNRYGKIESEPSPENKILHRKYHLYRNRNWKTQQYDTRYSPHSAPFTYPLDENGTICQQLAVINTAIEHNNLIFLKIFFDHFPKQDKHVSNLSTDALAVVKSKEMTEFLLDKKVFLINKATACPEEHRLHSRNRPGCPILAAHINRVGTEYEKEKKEKHRNLNNKLREVVAAAQK